ncbi:NAD-dependent epimerase/dehydratase family protein [Agrococcus sp. TF02-05]|uniref:NAD-dependent epimerase/dehydratase family protein n=1 Tax=Agrococcus sp. TF02-05 TaxID=2815211 RepID=UPI001AA128F1|nr:NAD-dependent epimerase/dehydratase family protein [Agrococcus sp. TF02-05]MBO1769485.1 NAD-dependent epimerase/dehydratase family protein [Agrococcus sp. TF02-05]
MTGIIVGALVALVVTLCAPIAALPLLRRLGVTDVANDRSSHTGVAVRALGVAPLSGVALAAIAVAATAPTAVWAPLAVCVVGTAALALVGLAEDVRGLPIVVRFAAQVLLGTGASFGLLLFAGIEPGLAVLCALAAGLAVAAYVNIANFMDGVDGISASHGVVAGLAYAALGLISGDAVLGLGGAILAAAMAGFAPWNLGREKRFLGDVGSYLLGAFVALLAIEGVASGVPVLAMLAPLAIYGADTAMTLLRRAARGARWYESHREHVYQQLIAVQSHAGVAATVAAASSTCALIGALVAVDAWSWWIALGALALVAFVYLMLPGLFGIEEPRWHLGAVSAPESYRTRVRSAPVGDVVVLGASGFVGSAVVAELRAQGLRVRTVAAPRLTTSARTVADIMAEASVVLRPDAPEHVSLQGADCVILAAGLATPDGVEGDAMYGANALQPAAVAAAAERAGVRRMVHLSSAAVQGRSRELDESWTFNPFSAYSRSKALGEAALAETMHAFRDGREHLDIAVIRATSVQGRGRATTNSLIRLASSRLSSVAAPPDRPTVVSSVQGLARFVVAVSTAGHDMQGIRLQPWEGHTTASALQALGGRPPTVLPSWLCRLLVTVAFCGGQFFPRFAGLARRLELLWFGQRQAAPSAGTPDIEPKKSWLMEARDG